MLPAQDQLELLSMPTDQFANGIARLISYVIMATKHMKGM